jgi:hypothetical protein
MNSHDIVQKKRCYLQGHEADTLCAAAFTGVPAPLSHIRAPVHCIFTGPQLQVRSSGPFAGTRNLNA